jgi:hypothetical protein
VPTTVELALDLLCRSPAEKFRRRSHLAADAPLLAYGLLSLEPGDASPRPPFLACQLLPDERLAGFLLGEPGLDPGSAELMAADDRGTGPGPAKDDVLPPGLLPLANVPLDPQAEPPRVHLCGAPGLVAR